MKAHAPLLCLLLCLLPRGLAFAQADTAAPVYIRGVEIYGNVTTRPEALKTLFAFDTGEVLDTAKLRRTRANLLATRLYDKADIFPHMREDGAHVFVVLKESVRLRLGYGGEYSTRRHGREALWYSFYADAGIDNFRGRFEEFWAGVGFWERRSLDVSWYKPFLSTPYFITLGAGAAAYPDYVLPIDYTDAYASAAAGVKTGARSRLSLSATPIYRHRGIIESAVDSSAAIPLSFRREIYEAFASLGHATDRRSARFDPRSGWYYAARLKTNRLYSGVNVPYFELSNELRAYKPFGGDVASARLLLTVRDRDAGAYHRLAYGGAGEIRGYGDDALGWEFVANSAFLASLKYHKQLYRTPQTPFPLVNVLFGDAGRRISFRFDATFIADYARLSRGPLGILTFSEPWQDGMGIGFGTRITVPEIRQSGCIDLVFGRIDDAGGSRWEPALHVYLDMFF